MTRRLADSLLAAAATGVVAVSLAFLILPLCVSMVMSFDARSLPSGPYLYRLRAGSFSQARRMLLVK